jgi:biopolymer transport protein ExbB
MREQNSPIIQTILALPIFRTEWVLYLLLTLSVVSIGVMIERWFFYRRRAIDLDSIRAALSRSLDAGDYEGAMAALQKHDSLETNVVLVGLKAYQKGPESVEDLIAGALGGEKARYESRLGFLATLASNAPYIGLFGTVLGIIRSFRDLATNMAEASSAVMAGIAEALIATAVGLLVAIPAVVAYNAFRGRVKSAVTGCQALARIVLSQLKSIEGTEPAQSRESREIQDKMSVGVPAAE